MKQLIGHDIGSYVFDASAKTITFSGISITQEQLLIATNTTDGAMIYCFADSSLGGVLSGSVLTLVFDTTTMSDADALQIYIDIPGVVQPVSGPLTDSELRSEPIEVNVLSQPPGSNAITNSELRSEPVEITIDNAAVLTVVPEIGPERQVAPFNYLPEEITDILDINDQIPISIMPALPGSKPENQSMPVALANEQIMDFQGATISLLNPIIGINLAVQDCLRYRQVAAQITTGTGVSGGVLIFEGSNGLDASNTWVAIPLFDQNATGTLAVTSVTLAASTNRYFCGPLNFRYFRIRVSTAVSGGFVSCSPLFRMTPFSAITNQVSNSTGNWSSNTAQIAGSAIVTGGVAGVQAVAGNIAAGATPTANPLLIGGVDYNNKVRKIITDSTGQMVMCGPAVGTGAMPIQISDDPGSLGRWNQSELLEMILMELKLQSFYLKELPLMLNMPGASFKEEITDFINNVDKI